MDSGYTDMEGARRFLGNCSYQTVYRAVRAGKINKYKLGTKTLFKTSELEKLVAVDEAGNDNGNPGNGRPEAGEPEAA
ncbi:excisionase family DNA binding protein [Labrenzia sp. EL_126]|nr:excisionase family DNA binding protein [Labrenzia sp. EL_126]